MPYLIPRGFPTSNQAAIVLAFGDLSVLEACSVMSGDLAAVDVPCNRIAVLTARGNNTLLFTKLVGAHKVASPLFKLDSGEIIHAVTQNVVMNVDRVSLLSVSGYCIRGEDYEYAVQIILKAFRNGGFGKFKLLRPHNNELRADEVLSRRAFDVVLFNHNGTIILGPTVYIPEQDAMLSRGTKRPRPNPALSMSPRLAGVLVNIAGVGRGQTLLDPFCGSGTILVEAAVRGINCFGIDINRRRIAEAKENISWVVGKNTRQSIQLKVADVRQLQEILGNSRVDAVVTEPILVPTLKARPKKESAHAMVRRASSIYAEALQEIAGVIPRHGRAVVVVPIIQTTEGSEVTIALDGRSAGLGFYQPGPIRFNYPLTLSFQSTRWVRRAVYVFEAS